MTKRTALSGYSLFQLLRDDPRFKLYAGDILVGSPYQYDPGKTSIAFRLSDGYRPDCNQYNSSIRALSATETHRAMWGGKIELPRAQKSA